MNYNLIEERWIPVLWNDGQVNRVGIREALSQAGRIRRIAATNPMDRVAILRFLLAVLYWCKGNPPDDLDTVYRDLFPGDGLAKLNDYEECFNLLGEGKRFYQIPSAQRSRTVTELFQEIPTGNNFWHFLHSIDSENGLCPACAVTGLLRLPLFSVSGLPDLKAGINGTPPIYAVPFGLTLMDTLCANWTKHAQFGVPAWIEPGIHPSPEEDVPILTGLTLLSRRVWLHDPTGPPGACFGCGRKEGALIRTCEFQSAGEQRNDRWDDPHVVYMDKIPRSALKAPDLTAAGKFRMDRPWHDLLDRIIEVDKFRFGNDMALLLIVGFATDQAKNIDVWERTIRWPSAQSINSMAASFIQQWQIESGRLELGKWLARTEINLKATVLAIRPHVEGMISAKASKLLTGGEEAWERAAGEYRPMMNAVAKSLSPGFTTAAVECRRRIASAMPNMRLKTGTAGKKARKKGGDE